MAEFSSPSTSSSSSFSKIEIEVRGYAVKGDVQDYNSHYWSIDVKLDTVEYTVDRSYVDFVDLDRRLRKKYPKSKSSLSSSVMPLQKSQEIQRQLNKEGSGYASHMKLRGGLPVFTGGEDVSAVAGSLDSYMRDLLAQHQIIASDELCTFLDEEAPNSAVDLSDLEPPSAQDYLFQDQVETRETRPAWRPNSIAVTCSDFSSCRPR